MTITMVTTSYPRFHGDSVGTFMEPIVTGVARRGHDVHVVAPWHPAWRRHDADGVHFHLYRYAPVPGLNVFGYAGALRADVRLRFSALAAAPLALVSGWHRTRQVVQQTRTSIVHAHWVIPSGVISAAAAGPRPLVISLHGSDVFVAERHSLARLAAKAAFRRASWVTACSDDLRERAVQIGALRERSSVVPYGVDTDRFKPNPAARTEGRAMLGIAGDVPLVFAFGRLVEKKGFGYLIDAAASLRSDYPSLRVVIAGEGDLDGALRARAKTAGVADMVRLMGVVSQQTIPTLLAAADVAAVPSVHDEAGNVDGLPNAVMEIMASGTPLVATRAGGIGTVATDNQTARLVAERDVTALARALSDLLRQPSRGAEIGRRARETVCREYSWARTTEAFEAVYARVTGDADRGARG
jgi:glycosyltransferase involved in cell wall biosynthesis